MKLVVGLSLLALTACSDDPASTPDAGAPPDAGVPIARECPALYDQSALQRFDLEIDPAEWDALDLEYRTWEERVAAGLPRKPYHPLISFRWNDLESTDAQIRLKGHSSWDQAKMQFQISFNETNPDGRLAGVRKILLDGPTSDPSFLRDRLASYWLAGTTIPASCANHAVLYVNGAYYGLFTNVEKVDKEFLQRFWGDDDEGALYKYGNEVKSNEEALDQARLDAWWEGDLAAIDEIADLDQILEGWAHEAVLPQADGYFAGRSNYYLYDHPSRGFTFIPWDFDAAFNWSKNIDTNPILFIAPYEVKFRQFDLVLGDPARRAAYLDGIERALDRYDVADLQARIDEWAAQIADAHATDPNAFWTTEDHTGAVASLRAWVADRADFLRAWLTCARGADQMDGDGDGVPWCEDCDETACVR